MDNAEAANLLTVLLLEDLDNTRPAVEATLDVVRTLFLFAMLFTSFRQGR
nr:MAG TPA: hypothetical protein [Caudoviricetes sp.]